MKTKAICMPFEDGESFPYLSCMNAEILTYPCTSERYEYWQPEKIEDEEFNLIILLGKCPVRVRGCHFDFVGK